MTGAELTEEEARQRLRATCVDEGGAAALARKLGITTSAISQQMSGKVPINGRVAKHLGIKAVRTTTISYRETSDEE